VLTEWLGWRSLFALNVLAALALGAAAVKLLPIDPALVPSTKSTPAASTSKAAC
jgi:predicted MFS family arabinose efflux permease